MLNQEIVSFRSCVSGCLVNWIKMCVGLLFPFSLLAWVRRGTFLLLARVVPGSFPFSLLVPGAFLSPPPKTSYPTLVGLIGMMFPVLVACPHLPSALL